ncbi:MAG: hypothetical protein B9S32_01315 [Verrucomicrobia bacterium Tous-C9LFEB]|nr:MAG: hypothetical protein B9S32_01315 [Verrucomicrobia bacterium Tous-C9LFEB]
MKTVLSSATARRGFTVLELLVVVGVLVTLIALSLPGFQSARLQAWKMASASNLRQLTEANMAYAADNGRFVPADDWWNNRRWCGARVSVGSSYDATKGLLAEYLGKSRRVTPCPLFTQMLQRQPIKSFEYGSGGYGYNAYVGGSVPGEYDGSAQRLRVSLPATRVASPVETIMFGTTALAYGDRVQEYPYLEPPFWVNADGSTNGSRPTPSLHFRFNGQAIVSWCDGHVSFEISDDRGAGYNPYGGDARKQHLGWFGPDENNGYWNPQK